MSDDRHYAVRLLWVHDQEEFDEYQDMARPILALLEHEELAVVFPDREGLAEAGEGLLPDCAPEHSRAARWPSWTAAAIVAGTSQSPIARTD